MMENNEDKCEFELFGVKVAFRDSEEDQVVTPDQIVSEVKKRAEEIKSLSPHIKSDKLSVLVALKLAEDYLGAKSTYKSTLDRVHKSAVDALDFVDQIGPKK